MTEHLDEFILALLGFLRIEPGNRFELDLIEGREYGEVTATVLYDAKGERLRA